MPPDQPLGQPPPIAGPVSGIAGISSAGQQQRRGDGKRQPKMATPATGESVDAAAPAAGHPVEPDPLVAALDRLRSTADRPIDLEVARLLRGRKEYAPPPAEPAPEPPPAG